MNYEASDAYIHKAVMYGASRIGFDASVKVMEPLAWYLNTGRASCDFSSRLSAKRPYAIFRLLHKTGGSYDDAILAIKSYLGVD